MNQQVRLRLDGQLETGFHVVAEIRETGSLNIVEAEGALPGNEQLAKALQEWRQVYRQLPGINRISVNAVTVEMIHPRELLRQKQNDLETLFKSWLVSESFRSIERQLRNTLRQDAAIQFLIRTQDVCLHHLPWHLWELVEEDYLSSEIMLSMVSNPIRQSQRSRECIKILAILGDRSGIDIEQDRAQLEQLPNADVTFLVEPRREVINDHLWDQDWDILFFAGHSNTEATQGRIYINPHDSLTLKELKYGLERSVRQGLQLAIFNSCDGLGLAYELEQLQIPRMIVMREPVPDRVAQSFLQYFLKVFSGGDILHVSVRQARERLQGLEGDFPCASWLPMVFKNPTSTVMSWTSLLGRESVIADSDVIATIPKQTKRLTIWRRLGILLSASLASSSLVMGVRALGGLQDLELKAYDQMLRMRSAEMADARILMVTVTEEDIQAQTYAQEPRRGSLSDVSLAKLLDRLIAYKPAVVGLDIYRDYPVSQAQPQLAKRLRQYKDLVGICKVSELAQNDPGIAPPPELQSAQVGFGDILLDRDEVIRRHYLSVTPPPGSPCQAKYSLSVQLALRYLAKQGYKFEFLSGRKWKIGDLEFRPIESRTGGYQTVDASGHQILLNYRSREDLRQVAQQISLGDLLAGKLREEMVKDRIVLIGTTASSFRDYSLTPYRSQDGRIRKVSGVALQAHMVSQLVSAVVDGRPLMRAVALWVEAVWVWGWTLLAGASVYLLKVRSYRLVTVIGLILVVSGVCLFLLETGVWMPVVPAILSIMLVTISLWLITRKVA